MEVKIEIPYLIFEKFTDTEFKQVKKLLTWKYTDIQIKQLKKEAVNKKQDPKLVNTKQSLLFKNDSVYYTYWGFHDIFVDYLNMSVNISNTLGVETKPDQVDPCSLSGITLYGFQVAAIRKALINKRGIIDSPTGSGKTEIMLGILKALSDKVSQMLIITPSVYLAKQVLERAINRGFNKNEIGSIFGGTRKIKKITVAVINSISIGMKKRDKEIIDLVTNSQALLFDECHHVQSTTNTQVVLMSKAEYVFGVSGSPFEELPSLNKYKDAITYGLLGKPIFKVSQHHLRQLGIVATPFVFFKLVLGKMARSRYWHNLYKTHVVEHIKRNKLITNYAHKLSKIGCPTLILIQQKKHAFNLLTKLPPDKTVCIFGDGTFVLNEIGEIEEIKLTYESFLRKFNEGEWNIVIATQVFDEGVDVPSIGAVIMAGAGRGYKKILQRVGRGVRKKLNQPNQTYIIDFMDRTHIYLNAQSKKRKEIYTELEIETITNEVDFLTKIVEHYRG